MVLILFSSIGYSQYYSPAQILNIHNNKLAYEGDMYLDTVNKDYYIGLTTGELAGIGDDQDIDSIVVLNDKNLLAIYISGGKADTVDFRLILDV